MALHLYRRWKKAQIQAINDPSDGCDQPSPTVRDSLAASRNKTDDQQSQKDCDPCLPSHGCDQPKPRPTVPSHHNCEPRKSDDQQSRKDCDLHPPSTRFKRRKENPDKENCSLFLNLHHDRCPGTCSVCPSTTTGVTCQSQPERSVHCVKVPNLNDVNNNEGRGLCSPSRSSSPLSREEIQLHNLGTERASKVLGRSPLRVVQSSKTRYLSPRAQAEDCPKQKPNNKGTEQQAITLQTKLDRLSPDDRASRWSLELGSCGSGHVSIKTRDDKSRPTQGNGRSQQSCAKRFDRSHDLGSTNIERIKYSGGKKTGSDLNDVKTNEGWGLCSPSVDSSRSRSSELSLAEGQLHKIGTGKTSQVLGRSALRVVQSSKLRYLAPRAQAADRIKKKQKSKETEQQSITVQTNSNGLSPDGSANRFDRSHDLGSTNIEQRKYSGGKKTCSESPKSNPYDHEKSAFGGSNLGSSILDDSSSVSLSEWLQDSLNLKVGADMRSQSRSRSALDSYEENCSEVSDWWGTNLQSSPKLHTNYSLTRKRNGPRDESHLLAHKCRRTEVNEEKKRGEVTSVGAFEFPTVQLLNDNCAMPSFSSWGRPKLNSTHALKHALASFAKLNLRPFWLEGRLCDKLYIVVLQKFVNNVARYYESLDCETRKDITSFIEEQRGSMINYLLKVCVGRYLS